MTPLSWMIFLRTLNTDNRFFLREAFLVLFIVLSVDSIAQDHWASLDRVCSESLRGLSVVDDNTVWASGSGGTWLRTSDAGNTWVSGFIPGAAKLDFRDIHAVDSMKAWVISAGDTCKIFRTVDGGATWDLQYLNHQNGIFFDGFAFCSERSALAYSDPIDGKFYIIRTNDGKSWKPIDPLGIPPALEGEAGFAASGTGICTWGDSMVWIATGGGPKARVFRSVDLGATWTAHDTPIVSKEGAGIFSMVFTSSLKGTIVGGSYLDSSNANANCAVTIDGGLTWNLIEGSQPRGYRSCVAASETGGVLLAIGRTGSEISRDEGRTWMEIGQEGYFACGIGKEYAWAVGRNGKIGKLKLEAY